MYKVPACNNEANTYRWSESSASVSGMLSEEGGARIMCIRSLVTYDSLFSSFRGMLRAYSISLSKYYKFFNMLSFLHASGPVNLARRNYCVVLLISGSPSISCFRLIS